MIQKVSGNKCNIEKSVQKQEIPKKRAVIFQFWGLNFLRRKIVALLTYQHHWLRGISKVKKRVFFGTPYSYLIFVHFSPKTVFLVQFFSTQKRVNRDQIDSATKQRKWQQNSMNCDKSDLYPHLSCGEICPQDKFVSTFLHMTDLSPYLPCGNISSTDNLLCGKFLLVSVCHVGRISS